MQRFEQFVGRLGAAMLQAAYREAWPCIALASSPRCSVNHRTVDQRTWHIGANMPLYARQAQHIISYFPYTSA